MRNSVSLAVLGVFALAGCSQEAPLISPKLQQGAELQITPADTDQYIVVYKSSVVDTRAEIAAHVDAQHASVERVYNHALRGWAGRVNGTEIQRLRNDPHVAYIERDVVYTVNTTQTPTPSWGLDRIDQRNVPLNNSYTYTYTGAGVHLYGIDTGILYGHLDFGGRAVAGVDEIVPANGAVDCNGHGTHTASTAGGTTYGVAKQVSIVGVRVLDCSGSGLNSQVIAGVDWVTQNAIKPAVANMSLGGSISSALDLAVGNSIASGVVYTIASGNSNVDACNSSPARVAAAITVNAADNADARASFSNFGTCTDLFAPGVNIVAAWGSAINAVATASGTSMAAPHVAGVAAQYLQANPAATPAQVASAIINNATTNLVTNPGTGSPNRLLYMGFISTNQPPSAAITAPANNASFTQGTSVTFTGSGSDPEDGALSGASLVWTSNINGQIGTGASFATTSLSVGTHTITLTAKDAGNLTATATRTITITSSGSTNVPPSAVILAPAANSSFATGASVTFSGSGWDTEDGLVPSANLKWTSSINGPIGTGWQFSTTTLSAGTHLITLTTMDSKGATGTKSITIFITGGANQPPTATITAPANNASFVQGSSVTFAGSGNDPETGALTGASLVWTSNVSGQIGTGTSFSTTTLPVGTHTITLTAKDPQNATGTATRTITITAPVNQPPTATITAPANNASFVQGSSVSFAGSGNDPETGALTGASLVWTSNINGQIGTGTSFSSTTLSVGTHTITLTATDPQSATGTATRTIVITAPVNQPPTATISAPANNASFVQGSSVSFAGSGNDPETGALTGASLVWTSNINGQIGIGTSFATTTLSVGTHTITLTATDAQNATGTATRTIVITAPANQPPTATITSPANNASFVQGSSVTFTGSGNDPETGALTGASLVWTSNVSGQIGTGTSFSTNTLPVGTHTITLTATDPQNATGTATRTIVITAPNQPPVANFTYTCVGFNPHQCQMNGTSSTDDVGIVLYSWNWGDGRSESHTTGISKNTWVAGTYNVTLTVTDGGGLTNSITKVVVVP